MKYIFTLDDMRKAYRKGIYAPCNEKEFETELKALRIVRNKQAQQIWKKEDAIK